MGQRRNRLKVPQNHKHHYWRELPYGRNSRRANSPRNFPSARSFWTRLWRNSDDSQINGKPKHHLAVWFHKQYFLSHWNHLYLRSNRQQMQFASSRLSRNNERNRMRVGKASRQNSPMADSKAHSQVNHHESHPSPNQRFPDHRAND